MRHLLYAVLGISLTFTACNNDTPDEAPTTAEQPVLKNPVIQPLKVEPQPTFEQSQLTNDALILCVQFKELNGQDRKGIFDKLESLLPNCPTTTGDNGETVINTNESVQVMTYNDLLELLGEPNELREDGSLGYYLTADEGYTVVFTRNAQQSIACRYLEANG